MEEFIFILISLEWSLIVDESKYCFKQGFRYCFLLYLYEISITVITDTTLCMHLGKREM